MHYSMGIDIGTTGIKAGLLDLATLRLESLASCELDHTYQLPAESLWQATRRVLKSAIDQHGSPQDIIAIGVAGQMHGAVLYDRRGFVIDPIITWQDQARCSPHILRFIQDVVTRTGYLDLGTEMACGYTGAILLWMKQHKPDQLDEIAQFSLISDFIRNQLLGANDGCTDPTNAFGTGLFNVRQNQWHTSVIDSLGLEIEIFPKVIQSTAVAGRLSPGLMRELGLPSIPVIYGGGDNQVSMIGSGLCAPDSPVLLNIGTAAQISKIIPHYQYIPGMDTRSFFQDHYALVGASLGGGGSYQWLREEIQRQEQRMVTYAEMDQRAARVPPGADGLIFCSGPSRMSPYRKRGFCGNLRYISNIGHQARAVMEGVLMDLNTYYAALRKYDHSLYMIGGGKGLQKSSIWPQIAADLFGKPIRITGSENVILGAAILAGFGTGNLEGLDTASHIAFQKEWQPDARHTAFYRREFTKSYHSQV